MAVDLDPERDAQEGPHQHQPGQNDEIVERWVDHQRLDDVAGDQKFQAEQDAAAERRAERAIGLGSVARPRPPRKQKGCEPRADQDGQRARQFQADHREPEEGAQPVGLNGDHTSLACGYC